jgi:predicted adenine nucleotide alpha hydrolase (AANH) superfamily ATPase
MCYTIRLRKVAELAANGKYDAFTTSLLVSPYQKHDLIKELGEKFAAQYGVEFYYRDFSRASEKDSRSQRAWTVPTKVLRLYQILL